MLEPWLTWIALGLAVVFAVARRREHAASIKLGAEQRSALGQLAEEVTSLREALLSSGAVERAAKLPPGPSLPEPSPASAGAVRTPDDPPSTKPVQSRTVPAPLRSEPLPVPVEDEVQRAIRRIERHAKVPPDVAARWERRLRALGAELGLPTEAEPTDVQLGRIIRELYEAEADVKDARLAAPPPLEATLASQASPSAQIPDVEGKPLPATVRPPPHRPPPPSPILWPAFPLNGRRRAPRGPRRRSGSVRPSPAVWSPHALRRRAGRAGDDEVPRPLRCSACSQTSRAEASSPLSQFLTIIHS